MVNLRWCLIAAFLLTACDGLTTETKQRRPVETDTRENGSDTGAPRDTDDDDTGADELRCAGSLPAPVTRVSGQARLTSWEFAWSEMRRDQRRARC